MSGFSDALLSEKSKETSKRFLTTKAQVDKIVESTKILIIQRRHIEHSIRERQEDLTTNIRVELDLTIQHNIKHNKQENNLLQQTIPLNKHES